MYAHKGPQIYIYIYCRLFSFLKYDNSEGTWCWFLWRWETFESLCSFLWNIKTAQMSILPCVSGVPGRLYVGGERIHASVF